MKKFLRDCVIGAIIALVTFVSFAVLLKKYKEWQLLRHYETHVWK